MLGRLINKLPWVRKIEEPVVELTVTRSDARAGIKVHWFDSVCSGTVRPMIGLDGKQVRNRWEYFVCCGKARSAGTARRRHEAVAYAVADAMFLLVGGKKSGMI